MNKSIVSNEWLDRQAARISALAEQAEEATRKGLENYRDIGQTLIDVKETLRGKGKGSFGTWCDENTPFVKQWRARLMKLADQWDAIEAKVQSTGLSVTSVDRAIALLRPPSATPIKASEANMLRGLVNHAAAHSGGPEADIAQRKLRQYAEKRGLPLETFIAAIVKRTDAIEEKKDRLTRENADLWETIRELHAILDEHNIEY